MTIPTIHPNGTAKDDLLEGLKIAYRAVFDAKQALRNTAPNGRDYYPQGNDTLKKAQEEHYSRIDRLQSVAQELVDIAMAIQKPQPKELRP